MKYRHQFHAGNFADVHKHVILLEVLRALTRKDKGLLFVDTHAGRGEYDLHPGDSAHPAEWQSGAAKILAATPRHAALVHYRNEIAVGLHGGSLRYSGSPLLAARALRAHDRIVLFETQREEAAHLREKLPPGVRARVEGTDGFAGLRALMPPPERRSCLLIDPPYEEREDLARVLAAVADTLLRFKSAVMLLWLPIKLKADFDAWLSQLEATAAPLLTSLLWMHPCDSRAALNGSAVVIVNPPYLVEQQMREWVPELCALLGGPRSGCEILTTSEPR
jgi:23S rRNA (adenine2030-N6)-methyltransferase